jgi:ABC-type lipoprotein release transport system permease subunit
VIIANTLLMAVFERVREMGILSALGMKGAQIRQMFLLEGASLGLAGVAVGAVLGLLGVAYLADTGIPLSDKTAAVAGSSFALGTTMRASFDWGTFAALSVATLVIVLLASFIRRGMRPGSNPWTR